MYARWKWTVRCGLCVVPLILFLAGSVVVYLQPSRYQSTAVFKYSGGRPAVEVVALLKSGSIFDRAFEEAGLRDQLQVSKDTVFEMMSHLMKTRVDPASGLIEVKVTHTRKEVARDFAAALPKALNAYESHLAEVEIINRMNQARMTFEEAEDDAEAKRKALAKLIYVRGEAPEEPAARLDVDAARADVESADKLVAASEAAWQETKKINRERRTWVEVITAPRISESPVVTDKDETLGAVILRSLGTGLGCALAVPYLLELLFPRVRRPKKPEHPAKYEEPVLVNATAGS